MASNGCKMMVQCWFSWWRCPQKKEKKQATKKKRVRSPAARIIFLTCTATSRWFSIRRECQNVRLSPKPNERTTVKHAKSWRENQSSQSCSRKSLNPSRVRRKSLNPSRGKGKIPESQSCSQATRPFLLTKFFWRRMDFTLINSNCKCHSQCGNRTSEVSTSQGSFLVY